MLYYQLNIDYIIETYCVNKEKPNLQCNGKCHLVKQLNISNDSSDEQSTYSVVYEAFYPLYFHVNAAVLKKEVTPFKSSNKWHYLDRNEDEIMSSIFQPPELIKSTLAQS